MLPSPLAWGHALWFTPSEVAAAGLAFVLVDLSDRSMAIDGHAPFDVDDLAAAVWAQ